MLARILITGLTSGVVYALLALGFSLVFGVARIINFAHTSFYMLAAYFIFTCTYLLSLNLFFSMVVSIVASTLIGVFSYKFIVERIREHEVTAIILTVALALVFQECMIIIFGSRFHGIDPYINGFVELFGVRIGNQHLLSLGVVFICIVIVSAFLYRSKAGLAIRGTAQDREMANLMGINDDRMCLLAVTLATALAAIAGIMVAPIRVVEPYMWTSPLVMILAVVILGGLGSIKGSLIGAFILGYAETLVVFLIPNGSFLKESFAMLIIVIVLLIKPEGLFGVVFEEERL